MAQALQGCFIRLRESPQHSEILDVALQNLAYIYQHREAHSPALVSEKIDDIYSELNFFIDRLEALVSSAMTDRRLKQARTLTGAHGNTPLIDRYINKVDGAIVGMELTTSKPKP